MNEIDVEAARAETPGLRHGAHLLACGSSLPPQVVVDAVIDHTRREAEIGGYEAAAERGDALDGVYDVVARHIGADRREIALMENATVAWQHAFYALPLKRGARVLTCEAEYAANYLAFLQRAAREDLKIDVVPSDGAGALDLEALERMIDDDVGVVSITWVPTNGGLVNPAAEVGRIARRHGVPYLLDACQAAGQMRIDVAQLGCDFLSATGRKFLRGPRGSGFLYVAAAWLDALEPAMIDMFGATWTSRERYTLRDDARRFETWENSYALRAGLGAAVAYADGLGIDAIERRVRVLAEHCRTGLDAIPGVVTRDLGRDRCGIVSFSLDGSQPAEVVDRLKAQGYAIGTSKPSSTRLDAERRDLPTLLRIAPHYFNTTDEIDGCLAALRALG